MKASVKKQIKVDAVSVNKKSKAEQLELDE